MKRFTSLAALAAAAWVTSCAPSAPAQPPVITPQIFSVTIKPTPSPTPTATPTPVPLAARVNDQSITLTAYQAELARYLATLPAPLDPSNEQDRQTLARLQEAALEALIEQALIEQEAARLNITVSEEQITAELAVVKAQAGGEERFRAWLLSIGQTESDVRAQLRMELLTSALRERVLSALPSTAEYIHAYHIALATEREARQVLARLQNGAQFTALAQSLSLDESTRPAGGDLGWFTRESDAILWPEVEEAAFRLQVGETSDIVASPIGYHIIRVIGREMRPLTESDAVRLQARAMADWIEGLKARARIERFN
jgi:parvulin-like peptidyl-prolyl isomerase